MYILKYFACLLKMIFETDIGIDSLVLKDKILYY